MELRTPTCRLRPLVAADAPSLAAHADDREVWRQLRDRFPHPYALHDAEAYVAAVAGDTPPTTFGIVVDGAAVGSIALVRGTDVARRTAEIGYWIGRACWGRGIATDALRAATAYALEALALHRVFALPFAHNAASCRVLEKCGYRCEGLLRRSAVKDGMVCDQWCYAITDVDVDGAALASGGTRDLRTS